MAIKEFLKPTIGKVVLTLILFIIFYIYWLNNLTIACPEVVGYNCSKEIAEARNMVLKGSIISIIPWYLISCLIIFIYKKFKKK